MNANETKTAEKPAAKSVDLDQMVEARQLSSTDASILNQQIRSGSQEPMASEDDVLRWLTLPIRRWTIWSRIANCFRCFPRAFC